MKSLTRLLVICLLSIPAQPNHAQATGLAVGVALNKMMDQVNTAIISARNAGNSVAIEAGRQVAIAISNAQNAYADSLNKTFDDHLNPTIRGTLGQLQTAANGVTTATAASLQDATARAQQIVNSIPFRQHEPQLTKFSPRFIVPAGTMYPVMIRFNGNFEFAARQEFTPTLSIGAHSYKPISSTTQELAFSVPVSDMFNAQATPKQFQYVTGTLLVPWQSTTFLGLFSHPEKDSYKLYLGALPSQIGAIKLTTTVKATVTSPPKAYVSTGYRTCSTSDCGNNDDLNHPYAVHPDSGCHVVKGTSHLVTTHTEGDWSNSFTGDDGDTVSYSVSTVHHSIGSSGSVNFYLTFQETCAQDVTNVSSQDIALVWGDSRVLPATAGTWLVSFDSFDGHHSEFADSNTANPFLKVAGTVNSVALSTADPFQPAMAIIATTSLI